MYIIYIIYIYNNNIYIYIYSLKLTNYLKFRLPRPIQLQFRHQRIAMS